VGQTPNPRNTIFDAKRLKGRKFNDELVEKDMKQWALKVVFGEGDGPEMEVD
jgi:L1 cell adhesion molecule like protein